MYTRTLRNAVVALMLAAAVPAFAGEPSAPLETPRAKEAIRRQFWAAYAAETGQIQVPPFGIPGVSVSVTPMVSSGRFVPGASNAPGAAFVTDLDTGWYSLADGYWGFVSNGTPDLAAGGPGLLLPSAGSLNWTQSASLTDTVDVTLARGGAGKLAFGGNSATPMILLGGTTSAFPAIRRSGAQVDIRLADDSAYAQINASNLSLATGGVVALSSSGGFNMAAPAMINTAPSAPSSCGTSPAVTNANGTVAWKVTGGTGGAATGCTVTMPTATNGWNCHITNVTQTAANRADRDTRQTASTTTSVTWQYVTVSTGAATAFTASDVFIGICAGY